MPPNPPLTFESCIDIIDGEIAKRKSKWTLTAVAWCDFADISQLLRIHIYKKWHLYKQDMPLKPWVNRIISNQIHNHLRSLYYSSAPPCSRCAANEGDGLCALYKTQCSACVLYKKWESKGKKTAQNIRLPVAMEFHENEVHAMPNDTLDIDRTAENIHAHIQTVLRPVEWKVYKFLYIEHKNESDVGKLLGYKQTEKGRKEAYNRLVSIKKSIIEHVKAAFAANEIDFIS